VGTRELEESAREMAKEIQAVGAQDVPRERNGVYG
jgi:hypothetical protein